jgi:hypothetical protein
VDEQNDLSRRGRVATSWRAPSLEELPLVYVVTALTAWNEDERKLVDGWSDTINRAVIEAGPAGEPVKDSIPRKSRET